MQETEANQAVVRASPSQLCCVRWQILGEDLEALGGPQAWNEYVHLSDSKYCGKMKVLEILLDMWYRATQQKNKVLVFSYSTKTLDIIQKAIERVGCVGTLPGGGRPRALQWMRCSQGRPPRTREMS